MTDPVCTVLVADDDTMNRLVAVESLKYLGAQATAVNTGVEVLEAMAKENFDLLLLDVHMPDMTGIEATLRIRAQERASGARRLPIVALTASATAKDQQTCLDAGMDGVLTKPYRIEQLDQVLKEWCGKR
ncbi:response regulator [Ideonella sp. BN130291]|uniref:response regulator n=1 Tax=Ideonella sp. BN130291 TaxID=3112940 RepID=UPI002E260016|nr:response regulator [Ideonella sp. BN130291]